MSTACREKRQSWTRVKLDFDALPDDPQLLKQLLREVVDKANAAIDKGMLTEARLHQALHQLYGRRSERHTVDPIGQGKLFELGAAAAPAAAEDASAADTSAPEPDPADDRGSSRPKPRKGRNGRRPLPEHLPREIVRHEIPAEDRICACCGKPRVEIGVEISEQVDYRPASLVVIRHERPKYACPEGRDGILTAEPPRGPIERGLPGPGMLAHVIVSKYADHLPLHRQEAIFARHGLEIPRSTLADWVREATRLATPLYTWLAAQVCAGRKIHTDDTKVIVLKERRPRGQGKRREEPSVSTGYLWVYVGDEEHPFTVYDYTPNRGRAGPAEFLKGFTGYLQADDYQGYESLYRTGRVREVACWAHVRRKFHAAKQTDPERSKSALDQIWKLYELEREIADLTAEDRLRARQEGARPVLERIEKWLLEQRGCVLPKSPIGKAIAYAIGLWPSLVRYVDDGSLAIDNNAAERAIKPVVIGRKNWLFAGSQDGARRAAVLCSVIETCRRHDVDPFAYLRDLFSDLPRFRGDVAELSPVAWKARTTAT